MTTLPNVQIDRTWTLVHGTTETIDVSCNDSDWFIAIAEDTPDDDFIGRELDRRAVIKIYLEDSDVLYGRVANVDTAIIAIDV